MCAKAFQLPEGPSCSWSPLEFLGHEFKRQEILLRYKGEKTAMRVVVLEQGAWRGCGIFTFGGVQGSAACGPEQSHLIKPALSVEVGWISSGGLLQQIVLRFCDSRRWFSVAV